MMLPVSKRAALYREPCCPRTHSNCWGWYPDYRRRVWFGGCCSRHNGQGEKCAYGRRVRKPWFTFRN